MVTISQSDKDANDFNTNDGPLSGSFHGTTSNARFSPQNSIANDHQDLHSNQQLKHDADKIQRKELTKTLSLDRSNDHVYGATTKVVKAIMLLSQGVEKAAAVEYLDLVRHVGVELRTLLSSVDTLASIFPSQALRYTFHFSHFILFTLVF